MDLIVFLFCKDNDATFCWINSTEVFFFPTLLFLLLCTIPGLKSLELERFPLSHIRLIVRGEKPCLLATLDHVPYGKCPSRDLRNKH